ncbi:YheC/YheD family protein [Mesobacillus harenae]|uniref:YheC/YheD family endospore coat-associated protein n=1 Tax=Mesobacillus harenae TaxID=2213203 RepID=UPI0015808C74|nr:YheC/YheD family protein [Mesobacillus harenae]
MITLGLMNLNLKSEAGYFTEIARNAEEFGILCYRFVPSKINPVSHQVTGEIFDIELMDWKSAEFPLPNIIYDRCFYGDDQHSRQCLSIVSWLKKRSDLKFLGYGLPNKWEIYQLLSGSELAPYLPKTIIADNPQKVSGLLQKLNKVILKPATGSQGHGIYCLEKTPEGILAATEKQGSYVSRTFPTEEKAIKWLTPLLAKKTYLLQPYLPLTNINDQPIDIRTLLQKSGNGNWEERGRGIRTGNTGGILSNLSSGGQVTEYRKWLRTVREPMKSYLGNELEEILVKLPPILENHFPPLFELGVDIGVAKDHSLWILDVNSKPGRKVVTETNPDIKQVLYTAPLGYCKTLFKTEFNSEVVNGHEKTLSN